MNDSSTADDCVGYDTELASSSLMQSLLVLGAEKNVESNDVEQEAAVSQQIQNYLKENNAKSTDPLQWWHNKKEIYPAVYRPCEKYFCIPATSAASELSFSSAGSTVTALRTRLTGSHVEAINRQHCNEQLLE